MARETSLEERQRKDRERAEENSLRQRRLDPTTPTPEPAPEPTPEPAPEPTPEPAPEPKRSHSRKT